MAYKQLTAIPVESVVFPPYLNPPGATNTFFLGGAGVRCLQIQSKLVKLTAIAVYLDHTAIPSLAGKWQGKNMADELKDSDEFYKDIITGPFEKTLQITMLIPMTGPQLSQKMSEFCVGLWVANDTYTDADAKIIDEFLQLFKDQKFQPGASIFFTISPLGSLSISFSESGVMPEDLNDVLEHEKLGLAMLEMLIGKHGVSEEAKETLATRLSEVLMMEFNEN